MGRDSFEGWFRIAQKVPRAYDLAHPDGPST
jgi:hypothetical protein